jgi:DNA helicase HerA-like ATPase
MKNFPNDLGNAPLGASGEQIGKIVSGSLSKGLTARLDPLTSVEDMAVGRYVVVNGTQRKFFGMITDVRLEVNNQQIATSPPDVSDDFIAEVLSGTSTYGCLDVMPMLTLAQDDAMGLLGPQPVKTVPSHFAPVCSASEADVSTVFGKEDADHFFIGQPLDMDVKVCISLRRLMERSSGVFGKSGTGKTFLTRLLLLGLVQSGAAVNLIFDMHNEYGHKGTYEGGGKEVKALKQLFPGRVAIFTLDPESSRARGASGTETLPSPAPISTTSSTSSPPAAVRSIPRCPRW